MSQENVQVFLNNMKNDTSLGEEYKTLLMSCKELSKEDALEKVVGFAQGKGYSFSSEDIQSFSKNKESDELQDEELDAVAGGIGLYWAIVDMS